MEFEKSKTVNEEPQNSPEIADREETVESAVADGTEQVNKSDEKKAQKEAARKKKAEEKAAKKDAKKAKKDAKKAAKNGKKQWSPLRSIEKDLAGLIDTHDRMQESFDRMVAALGYSLIYEYHDARTRYRENARSMMIGFFSLIVVICILLLVFDHFTVYQYSYNGRVLGYVKHQEDVYNILDVAGDELSKINDANIEFTANDNVTFKEVSSTRKDVDDADTVLNKLTYMTEIEVVGYGIYENGKLLSVVESQGAADRVLAEVISYYTTPDSGMKVDEIKFKNAVEVKPVNVLLTSVQTRAESVKVLEKGGQLKVNHIVMEDEDIHSLSETYGADADSIKLADDGEKATSVEPGEEVKISKKVGAIKVLMTESGTMKETIKYKTIEKKTKDLYRGDTAVKQEGENGSQLITGTLYYENGKETKRDIKKKEVLKKSVDKIVLVGTNDKPKWFPTGTYKFPVANPVLTSWFGSRWGTNHNGLDFSASTGTPIYAADGGTVIRASYFAGYGLCVDIEHNDGTFTRYGHNSQVLVKAGDKVAQGEKVALAGSTGHSTGPHCHFEIHPNGGDAVDPYPYLYGTEEGNKRDSGL